MGFNYKLPQSLNVVTVKRRLIIPVSVQLEANPNEGAFQYLSRNRKHFMQSLDGILLDWNTGKIRLKNKAVLPYFQARVAIKGEFTILKVQKGEKMTATIVDQKPSAIAARTLENFLVYIEIPNEEIVFSPGDEVQFTFDSFDWEDINPVIYGVNPVRTSNRQQTVGIKRNTVQRQESVVQQKRKDVNVSPEPLRKKKKMEDNPSGDKIEIKSELTSPSSSPPPQTETPECSQIDTQNLPILDTPKSPKTPNQFTFGTPKRLPVAVSRQVSSSQTMSSSSLLGQSDSTATANDSSNLFERDVITDLTDEQASMTQSSPKSREKVDAPPGWTRRIHQSAQTQRKWYTFHSPLGSCFKSLKAAWHYHEKMMLGDTPQSDIKQKDQSTNENKERSTDIDTQIKIKDIKSMCNNRTLIKDHYFEKKINQILAGKNRLFVNSREGPTQAVKIPAIADNVVTGLGDDQEVLNVDDLLADSDPEPRKHKLPKVIQGKDFISHQKKKKKTKSI